MLIWSKKMTDFVKALRLKGWSAQQVAKRWGVTPRRISQIGKNPRQKDWDALNGLPERKQA
jgi:transcriptional regulator